MQSAKNNEVWRLASDTDIADCLGEIREVLVDPLSEIWEPLTEASWLLTSTCYIKAIYYSNIQPNYIT